MKSQIIKTEDGSNTIYLPAIDETYHSNRGALSESMHVFIDAGLAWKAAEERTIRILEIGAGTGLNALLSYLWANKKHDVFIEYVGIELYPLQLGQVVELEYQRVLNHELSESFLEKFHNPENLNKTVSFDPNFTSLLLKKDFTSEALPNKRFDLIYFDAFAPAKQEEMWQLHLIQKLFDVLEKKGGLVTYASQGAFRRKLEAVGFEVERLKGPNGKRHMVRAIKA